MSARGGTLLAKMGFRDSDRADPMHDAACAYVAANAKRVYAAMTGKHPRSTRVTHEQIVSKGSGQYQTTVGFVDLIVEAAIWERRIDSEDWCRRTEPGSWELCLSSGLVRNQESACGDHLVAWTRSECHEGSRGPTLGVEVKWTENSVSDAIRQVSVYKTFMPNVHVWALATPRTLNIEQKAALDSNGFKYIRLSEENVRAFAAKQRATPAASEMVL